MEGFMDMVRRKIYSIWNNMKRRCSHEHYKSEHPTYRDVYLCDEWVVFDNFYNWVLSQNWGGLSLDKDLLTEGNKVYSPDTCLFIDQSLNKFITLRGAMRGDHPLGVNYKKSHDAFVSQIMEGGKKVHLGVYLTPFEAHKA
jgi:hypothetical protein